MHILARPFALPKAGNSADDYEDAYWPRRAFDQEVAAKPLPWYAEEKMRSGAFSSLAGLTLHGPAAEETGDGAGGAWESFAVGDSCLFQVRADELIVAFPLGSS